MSLESDAAGPRSAHQNYLEDQNQMASLGASPADFSAFYLPTTASVSQPNNFYSSFGALNANQATGFSPYDRYNSSYQLDRFNPPRNNRPQGYPPHNSGDPWQHYRQDAFGPGQQFRQDALGPGQMQNQGDYWGQYWSNYFNEGERRGYRPPPQDGPRRHVPGDRRYPPSDRTTDQPAAPLDRTGSRQAMEQVTDPNITNDVSRRRNGERVDPVYVGIDNRESYKGADGRKHIRNAPAWLDRPAAQAFLMINEELAKSGKRLMPASHCADCANINSLGRTNTQQAIATGLAARPGNSEHERGAALDVKNHTDPEVHRLLLAYGFVQGNLSRPNVPIRGDAHHYSFDIRNATRIAQMWERSETRSRLAAAGNQDGPASGPERQDGPRRQARYEPDTRRQPDATRQQAGYEPDATRQDPRLDPRRRPQRRAAEVDET